jgi:hypothetical protein
MGERSGEEEQERKMHPPPFGLVVYIRHNQGCAGCGGDEAHRSHEGLTTHL